MMAQLRGISLGIAAEVLRSLAIAVGIVVLTFFLLRMIPGDVVDVIGLEGSLTYEQQANLRAEMGLTRSWWEQFWLWLGMIAGGDFGLSSRFAIPVTQLIGAVLGSTITLGLSALTIGICLGIGLPVLAAIYPRSAFVWLAEAITIWSITVPTFSTGIAAVVVFAVWLGMIPAIGNLSAPALILGIDIAGSIAKILREDMKEIESADFIRTARAKGLSRTRIVLAHILPNAMTVTLALVGLIFSNVLTGAITMEIVFGRPGIGTLALQAIKGRDYPLVQTIIIWLGIAVIIANLVADIAQRFVDPRIRLR